MAKLSFLHSRLRSILVCLSLQLVDHGYKISSSDKSHSKDYGKGKSRARPFPLFKGYRSRLVALTIAGVFCLVGFGEALEIPKNPLKNFKCELISEDSSYSEAQRTCLRKNIGDYVVGLTTLQQNPKYIRAKTLITGNPLGYPKLDFITFFKAIVAFMCEISGDTGFQDGNAAGVLATAVGTQRPLQAVEVILETISIPFQKAYVALGGLQKAPKIGTFFGSLRKGLKFPNEKIKGR